MTTPPAPLHPLLLMADWIEEDAAIGRLIEDTPIPRPPGWFRELQVREMQHDAAEEALKQLNPGALRTQAAALAAAEAERHALREALGTIGAGVEIARQQGNGNAHMDTIYRIACEAMGVHS